MARITMDGLDAMIEDLESIMELPDKVVMEMLNAEADVVEKAQKDKLKKFGLIGRKEGGQLINSIRRTKKLTKKNLEKAIFVYPQGVRRGSGIRNAEVGFILEYGAPHKKAANGKGGISPTHWMKQANEECAEEAVEKAAQVYDNYLKQHNL
ncbi:MAG: hypothetical protein J6I64_07395 [Lachnospiraceae bacterium]|nr:hypothetical protein [Lachnospiraceae bacterium]